MAGVPEYSPVMLRLFITARIVARRRLHGEAPAKARKAVSAIVQRDAGVTPQAFGRARAGTLVNPALRTRIWCALGHEPDFSRAENCAARSGTLPANGPDARSRSSFDAGDRRSV